MWIAATDLKPATDRPLPLICYPEGCIYLGRMLQRLAKDGLPWRIAMTSTSFTSIISAVESGLGVSAFAGVGR